MREVQVSIHDLDDLGEKIYALRLSESQRALLSNVLAVVRDVIESSEGSAIQLVSHVADQDELIVVPVDDDSPSLRKQIRSAFIPGAIGPDSAGHDPLSPMKVGEGVARPSKVGEGVARPSKVGEGVARPSKVGEDVFQSDNRSRSGYGGVSAKKNWPASRHPGDDIDLLAANAAPGSHPNFTYQGGRIISNPKVYTSYWGSAWEKTRNADMDRLDQFVQDFLASNYMNILSQYGVGSGAFVGRTQDPDAKGTLTDAEIHMRIQSLIDKKELPEPGPSANVGVLIYLDNDISVSDPDLDIVMCEPASDTAFGYHYFFVTKADSHFYYAVIPGLSDKCLEESCRNNADCSLSLNGSTVEERVTQVTSHEFSEMVTDPEIDAWRDPSDGSEIGDICNGERGTIEVEGSEQTWNVQRMYSYYDDVNNGNPCVVDPEIPLPNLREPYQQLILSTEIPFSAAEAAGFIFSVADYNGDGKPDLLCLNNNAEAGLLEIQVLSHASNYQQLILRTKRLLDAADFDFAAADYTGDGTPDLLCLKKTASLEIQVLSHASNYRQLILRTETPFDPAGFDFAVADYTGDGTPDLLCLNNNAETGLLEIQVLSHASHYQQLTRLIGTPLTRPTGKAPVAAGAARAMGAAPAPDFVFAVADYDGDGKPDLFCLNKTGTPGVEVQVLSGAPYFP